MMSFGFFPFLGIPPRNAGIILFFDVFCFHLGVPMAHYGDTLARYGALPFCCDPIALAGYKEQEAVDYPFDKLGTEFD